VTITATTTTTTIVTAAAASATTEVTARRFLEPANVVGPLDHGRRQRYPQAHHVRLHG
jgi:hypothetical protein